MDNDIEEIEIADEIVIGERLETEESEDEDVENGENNNEEEDTTKVDKKLRRGCNTNPNSKRAQLQSKRAQLNFNLDRQLKLLRGAENLYRATTNGKVKETVALELSFVNASVELLKEEILELNGTLNVYQSISETIAMPMIPLGLKETTSVDFGEVLKDFVLEHYSEDGEQYQNEIIEFNALRDGTMTPARDEEGIDLLFEYYNQLYFIDNRFFPPSRQLAIYLTWYDSLTGIPSIQRTCAFEKASALFNIGALYTQIGAR